MTSSRRNESPGPPDEAFEAGLPRERASLARCTHEDVRTAFAAARAGPPPDDALEQAARVLTDCPDPDGRIAAALGLESSEFDEHTSGLARELQRAVARARALPPLERASTADRPSTTLLVVHGSASVAGTWARLLLALGSGKAVVWFADPGLPELADRAHAALREAGLAPDRLFVLHDGTLDGLRSAARIGTFDRFTVAAPPEHENGYARIARSVRGSLPFGAGLVGDSPVPLVFESLHARTARVEEADDVDRRADEIVLGAFGRASALSGQRAGAIGAVLVHPRRMSRFTAAVLERLEAGLPGPSLVPFDSEAEKRLETLLRLGLDEGATLIHQERRASRATPREAILERIVFTNVLSGMQIARERGPAAALILERSSLL